MESVIVGQFSEIDKRDDPATAYKLYPVKVRLADISQLFEGKQIVNRHNNKPLPAFFFIV